MIKEMIKEMIRLRRQVLVVMMIFALPLTACSSREIRIRPQLPEKPSYAPVTFVKKDGFYCLDSDGAKNLIYNIEALKTYADDLLMNIQAVR